MKKERYVLVDRTFHQGNSVGFFQNHYTNLENPQMPHIKLTHDLRLATVLTEEEIEMLPNKKAKQYGSLTPYKYSDLLKITQSHILVKNLPKSRKNFIEKTSKKHNLPQAIIGKILVDFELAHNLDFGTPPDTYVVVDTRQECGKSAFFWCNDGSGYTVDFRMAARYCFEEAKKIEDGRGTDKLYDYFELLPLVELHVDIQDLTTPIREHSHTFYHLGVRG